MRWRDWLPFGRVPEVAPDDLARRLADDTPVQLVDVRTGLEFRQGHIAGARHVPVLALEAALPELALDPQVPVVAICKTAHRSIPAVRLLQGRGLRAMQLAGGMDRWRRRGLPVVVGITAPEGETS
jgi:rhodanese-related sulfurtransferase